MTKSNIKSYSKFTFEDLKHLGLKTAIVDLFVNEKIAPIAPSAWLVEALKRGAAFSLNTEKAKSEFIIAPVLNEVYQNNLNIFAVYSGFNFNVEPERGLQGFCDFLLAKLPLNIIPETPIIAVVEAKLTEVITAAVPQCAAEMYATRLWNEKQGEPTQTIFGVITTGDNWLFLRYEEGNLIEIDRNIYPLKQLSELLGVWQHIVNYFK
jgi:hypothetical protein